MPSSVDAPLGTTPEDLVELGRVASAYGVQGWVKIQPHAAGGDALLTARVWWLRAPILPGDVGALPIARAYPVLASRKHGATVVAQLGLVNDRDMADALKAHTVWVPRANFPASAPDEYYWVDLIGCSLYGEHQGAPALIGVVQDVVDNGAHAVLQVARQSLDASGLAQPVLNSKGRSVEVLVPFVAAHVHTVDIAGKRLDSNWPVEW
ncbi:ribosome maturation factor RimM [Pusillimonas sp. TS35]|uniref:ribosome maturation factor RimM n=1 Tax=Paracandidimonas lactea TaxID=2895524 RepID=UPI0013701F5C|nr:ribosome maturation factor RimM [Paracandidimonas lactea]MYN11925.1 ribosome maturation factor RimM [Pusillimonas sp. TS35]